jgi:hypothetical protein
MIHCKLHGRLGNNLFTIATGLSLAKKLNTKITVGETALCGHYGIVPIDLSLFEYKFTQTDNVDLEHIYNEPTLHYTEIEPQDNITISGVFGSWKYFEDIKEELCSKYFTPSKEIIKSLKKYNISSNALGISVRRGDFLMLQHNHCVLTLEYYQTVINNFFQNNIDSIYIFSDDIEWCKGVFGDEVHYVNDSAGVQLFLMTKMKHLIMSNSTFAWWGAYLNQNNGIIVIPDPWLGPAYDHENTNDIYYPSWIRQKHTRVFQGHSIDPNLFN